MAGYKGTWWDSLSSMMQTFTKEGGSDKFDATFKINDKPSQVLGVHLLFSNSRFTF